MLVVAYIVELHALVSMMVLALSCWCVRYMRLSMVALSFVLIVWVLCYVVVVLEVREVGVDVGSGVADTHAGCCGV